MAERNKGIDALRVLSMAAVVILHLLGLGGLLGAVSVRSGTGAACWLLEILCYCAVNCYGLISGFVGWNRRLKPENLVLLWLPAVLYGVLFTAFKAVAGSGSVTLLSFGEALTPVLHRTWWFLTAYLCMSLFRPLMNAALQNLEKKTLCRTLAAVIAVCTVLPAFSPRPDLFRLFTGYSPLWLCILYLIGGCAGKYGDTLKSVAFLGKHGLAVYLLTALAQWGYGMLQGDFAWLDSAGYASFPMLLEAAALSAWFSGLRVTGFVQKAVDSLAPAAFGVYLIHTQPVVWSHIEGATARLAQLPAFAVIPLILAVAAAADLGCSALEILRIRIFEKAGIWQKLSKLFEKW